jgi:ABC-type branched-subunit amino acid transport system substrate-binding protein
MSTYQASRRTLIKGLGAATAVSAIGMPAILRAAEPVKIGFLAPLTGDEALLGITQRQCFELAMDDIKAAGGIAGREAVAIIEDDETNTKATIDKTRKLIAQDNVDVVLGVLASFERKAAMSVTIPAKKLFIYPTYYEGGDCNKYLICTGQLPNQQIDPLVSYLVENVGKTIYVIGHDYIWPRGSTEQMKKALEPLGGKVVGADFYPFGTQDFGPAFAKVKEAKPDIVWLILVAGDAVTAVKQYRSFGMQEPLVFHAWDDSMLAAVNASEQAGILSTQAYYQPLDNPVNKAFTERFAKKFGAGVPINAIGESTYASTLLYAKAVEATGGDTTPEKVIEALAQVVVDAPHGKLTVDPATNHARNGTIIARVNDKAQFEVIKVTEPVDPLAGCTL